MVVRSINPIDFNRLDFRQASNRSAHNVSRNTEEKIHINVQDEMNYAAEEMLDLLSTFGRFSKIGRKNDSAENDFVASMLEDKADEKLGIIVRKINQLKDAATLINFSRNLFQNDSDLMLALRELLLNRQLSELQKRKIKESIADLDKFCDSKKMNSGINIGHLAKRFSSIKGERKVSAKELRESYLRFLEVDLPASFIYQDWIEEFGCDNRTMILSFTLSALVSDMKASMPGIHFDEFGALGSKLSDARILHTADQTLIKNFDQFDFKEKLKCADGKLTESDILDLFMIGLIDSNSFKSKLFTFNNKYMSDLLISQRAETIQTLRNIYNSTPDFLYADLRCQYFIKECMSSLMLSIYEKEIKNMHW